MSPVSDELIGRAKDYVGRELTRVEVDDFRRMSELLARRESDLAWTIILAMWAARIETTTALTDAGQDVRRALDAWMERVETDLAMIDEKRRSSTQEAAAAFKSSAAAVHRAAGQGTAVLSSRLEDLETKVANMAATVDRAMAGATGALAAANQRDIEVGQQVKTLADQYARHLTEKLEARTDAAFRNVETRIKHLANFATVVAKPLLLSFSILIVGIFIGSISGWVMAKWILSS